MKHWWTWTLQTVTVWGSAICGHFYYTERALPIEEIPPPWASLETKAVQSFITPFVQLVFQISICQLWKIEPYPGVLGLKHRNIKFVSPPPWKSPSLMDTDIFTPSEWSRSSLPFPISFVHLHGAWLLLFLLEMQNLFVLYIISSWDIFPSLLCSRWFIAWTHFCAFLL